MQALRGQLRSLPIVAYALPVLPNTGAGWLRCSASLAATHLASSVQLGDDLSLLKLLHVTGHAALDEGHTDEAGKQGGASSCGRRERWGGEGGHTVSGCQARIAAAQGAGRREEAASGAYHQRAHAAAVWGRRLTEAGGDPQVVVGGHLVRQLGALLDDVKGADPHGQEGEEGQHPQGLGVAVLAAQHCGSGAGWG